MIGIQVALSGSGVGSWGFRWSEKCRFVSRSPPRLGSFALNPCCRWMLDNSMLVRDEQRKENEGDGSRTERMPDLGA